jgi:uncharacterized protein
VAPVTPWRSRRAQAFVLALAAGALWGFVIEPRRLVVREATLPLGEWSGRPLRMAVLSDLHVGSPANGRSRLARVVATVNAQRPDVVVLLGDYVIQGVLGGRFVAPEEIAAELSRLSAPHGVYAVLGNHDWWLDGERVRRALEGGGLRVLENEATAVELGGRRLWIAGLADLWTRKVDVAATLRAVPPGEPVVLAMHHPDLFPDLPKSVTLALAGHTHGGQVRLPFFGAPVVPSRFGQRYAAGLVVEGGRAMFVTSGVGTSILPVRVGVPPEVVILTLSSRAAAVP